MLTADSKHSVSSSDPLSDGVYQPLHGLCHPIPVAAWREERDAVQGMCPDPWPNHGLVAMCARLIADLGDQSAAASATAQVERHRPARQLNGDARRERDRL